MIEKSRHFKDIALHYAPVLFSFFAFGFDSSNKANPIASAAFSCCFSRGVLVEDDEVTLSVFACDLESETLFKRLSKIALMYTKISSWGLLTSGVHTLVNLFLQNDRTSAITEWGWKSILTTAKMPYKSTWPLFSIYRCWYLTMVLVSFDACITTLQTMVRDLKR